MAVVQPNHLLLNQVSTQNKIQPSTTQSDIYHVWLNQDPLNQIHEPTTIQTSGRRLWISLKFRSVLDQTTTPKSGPS